jgi:outer membrane protein
MSTTTDLLPFRISPAGIRLAILAVGLIMPMLAFAELSNDTILGPGLRWRPAYDGSASQSFEFVPVVRYFGKPWFIRSTQSVFEGGVRFELASGLHVGAQLAYESERSDSDFLKAHNLPRINPGASFGAQLEWDFKIGPMPLTLITRVRQNLDFDLGAQIDLRLSGGILQWGPLSGGLYLQTAWADNKSTNSFYGVTPTQSAASGLPAFDAGSGFLFGSLGFLWSFDFTKHWLACGSLEARSLLGDAERSPLTERSINYYVTAGLAYRF